MATEFFKRARLAPVRSDASYIARNIVTGQGQFFEARRDVPPLDELRQIVLMLPSKRDRAFGLPMSFMVNGKVRDAERRGAFLFQGGKVARSLSCSYLLRGMSGGLSSASSG